MKKKAILTLILDQQEILKAAADKLFLRSCEFTCNYDDTALLREQGQPNGRFRKFAVRIAVNPLQGPCPQYVEANGQVTSLRRHSQDSYAVIVSFELAESEDYRLISQHLSDGDTQTASMSVPDYDADSALGSVVIDIGAIKANAG